MICASIANINYSELEKIISDFEMIELRLDWLNFDEQDYQKIYRLGKPVIATYRYGETEDSIREEALQKAIVLGANYVDIEIDADAKFIDKMMRFAQQNNCKTILSYHNFESTPSLEELNLLIEKSKQLQADYIKIACMANQQKDVARILSLYENHSNLIAFNMGAIGKISRLASLSLGAEFTYAALSKDNSTANGQLTYSELEMLTQKLNN